MTESSNLPFTGLMVKAKAMPDLRYPRFQKWYSSSSWLSSSSAAYIGHECAAGRNFTDVGVAHRKWNLTTPPTRSAAHFSTTHGLDLTTPWYMLADTTGATASTRDTIVGPDYCNVPIRMYQDLDALAQHSDLETSLNFNMFARTLAINHQFTFINNSRFPLEVYYTVLPIGHLFNPLAGQFTPHEDLSSSSTFKKITIPAIRDAGDKGSKRTIDLSMNLKKMWPLEYEIPPGPRLTNTTEAGSTIDCDSPWLSLDPGATTNNVFRNFPPGQMADDRYSTPDLQDSGPVCGLRMQWFAKLQQPRNLAETTEGSVATGDYAGNNYDVHWKAAWLMDMIKVGDLHKPHAGEKAYPSQVA